MRNLFVFAATIWTITFSNHVAADSCNKEVKSLNKGRKVFAERSDVSQEDRNLYYKALREAQNHFVPFALVSAGDATLIRPSLVYSKRRLENEGAIGAIIRLSLEKSPQYVTSYYYSFKDEAQPHLIKAVLKENKQTRTVVPCN